MKKQYLYTALFVALGVMAVWAGRIAWRAHKDIVSLQVRNLPLEEVIRQIEWQTWEQIVADAQLDTQITLNVEDMSLREVLERIAEQASATMTTVHAVHASSAAIKQLILALQAGDVTKAKGWTNLAPSMDFPADRLAGTGDTLSLAGEDRMKGHFMEAPLEPGIAPLGSPRRAMPMMVRRNSAGSAVEIIVPERIVIETNLQTSLEAKTLRMANLETARSVARIVDGNLTTLYSLKKSAVGFPGSALHRHRAQPAVPGSTNTPPAPSFAEAVNEARRADLGRYINLTPEQRVERSRNRRPMKREGQPPQ